MTRSEFIASVGMHQQIADPEVAIIWPWLMTLIGEGWSPADIITQLRDQGHISGHVFGIEPVSYPWIGQGRLEAWYIQQEQSCHSTALLRELEIFDQKLQDLTLPVEPVARSSRLTTIEAMLVMLAAISWAATLTALQTRPSGPLLSNSLATLLAFASLGVLIWFVKSKAEP